MKKLMLLTAFIACAAITANAQTQSTTVKEDKKVTKHTSTVPQKVHNTFSKKKHYSGKKTTHKTVVEQKNTTPQ